MNQLRAFVWRLAIVLVVLGAAMYGLSIWHGSSFWKEFLSSLLSTAFGIIISAALAYTVWLHQQSAQRDLQRRQLVRDLRSEVNENLRRLANLEAFLNETDSQGASGLRVQGLRTSVMKHALNPENAIILQDPDLEDDTDWVAKQCDEFDDTIAHGFEQFFADMAVEPGGNGSSEARMRFWREISPHVDFLTVILKQLAQKLEEYGAHK